MSKIPPPSVILEFCNVSRNSSRALLDFQRNQGKRVLLPYNTHFGRPDGRLASSNYFLREVNEFEFSKGLRQGCEAEGSRALLRHSSLLRHPSQTPCSESSSLRPPQSSPLLRHPTAAQRRAAGLHSVPIRVQREAARVKQPVLELYTL